MTIESNEPSLRIIALHDLNYCHRLFYLTEVEGLQAPNEAMYAGRELHASLEADEEGERTQLELADPVLGLFGKVDAIRRRDGSILPYEHKRGRCRRGDNGPEAWPSDRLQVIAYAALIASSTGQTVVEGRVRYHADNVTVRVPFDDRHSRIWARPLPPRVGCASRTERPPVTENERLCVKCSLAPVCLPEEVRQAEDPEHEPLRLFPPDRNGTSLHVLTAGATVGRSGEEIVVHYLDDKPDSRSPIRELDAILAPWALSDHDPGAASLPRSRRRRALDDDLGAVHHQRRDERRPGSAPCSAVPCVGRRGDMP